MTKNNQFIENPIFLLGVSRSGTTLLQSLLDFHEEVLTIPAELHYYLDWKKCKLIYGDRPVRAELNEYFLSNTDLRYFGRYVPVGTGNPYDTTSINGPLFKEYLHHNGPEFPTSKEYLQLIVKALLFSWPEVNGESFNFKHFFVGMNAFYIKEILYDFPNAKVIIMSRNKLDVYISWKNLFLKNTLGYYNPQRRKEQKITLRKTFMLETLMSKMVYAEEKTKKHMSNKKVYVVYFDDLINNPRFHMNNLSKWLGIKSSPMLLQTTIAGKIYGGNKTDGTDCRGKIDKPSINKITKNDITPIEYLMLKRVFPEDIAMNSKIEKAFKELKYNLLNFPFLLMAPLKGETVLKSKNDKIKPKGKKIMIIYLLLFPFIYLKNRYIIAKYIMRGKSN